MEPRKVELVFDEKKLARVLKQQESTTKFLLGLIPILVPNLAAIIGGLWALVLYFGYQREQNDLALAKARREESRQQEKKFAWSLELDAYKRTPSTEKVGKYYLVPRVEIENTSEELMTVDYAVYRVYVGRANKPLVPSGTVNYLNSPGWAGVVEWEERACVVFLRKDYQPTKSFKLKTNGAETDCHTSTESNDGGTGRMLKGQIIRAQPGFVLAATDEDFVGVHLDVAMDGDPKDVQDEYRFIHLGLDAHAEGRNGAKAEGPPDGRALHASN